MPVPLAFEHGVQGGVELRQRVGEPVERGPVGRLDIVARHRRDAQQRAEALDGVLVASLRGGRAAHSPAAVRNARSASSLNSTNRTSSTDPTPEESTARTVLTAIRAASSIGQP